MAASSSSFSGFDPSPYKYDVFLSVRGDVRHNFTSLLYSALLENQLEVFVESEIEDFSYTELETYIARAIEKSAIFIIVFSEGYFSSRWCKYQYAHIRKCQSGKGQIILPILHGVDPSDVKDWKEILIQECGLPIWDSRGKSDPELVEEVVQDVVRRITEIWSTGIDNSNGLMGGAFLSAFVEDLFRRLRSPNVVDYLKGKEPIQKKFIAVKIKFLSANRVLNVAEDQQLTNASVKEWLDHLKVLLLRADQLMDNINYEVLRRKLEGASESSLQSASFAPELKFASESSTLIGEFRPKLKGASEVQSDWIHQSMLQRRRRDIKNAFLMQKQSKLQPERGNIKDPFPLHKQSYSMEAEIAGIFNRLEPLVAQKDRLGLKEPTENIVSQRLHGAPLAFKPGVYDREDAKEAIVKSVLSDETYGDKTPLVLPIVGAGGISKTTPGEDLNAHPDLPIIGQETGGIGKTNLGEYLNAHPDLQGIDEEVVNKCKGHPIAVKSVVALLSSIASPDERRMILENHIWDLKLQENASKDVLPALWLSYRYLSPLLKRCLVYCSIFPKGYEFDKKKVILLWMAEGLLQSKRRTRMEDVGEDFFKILTRRSFFEESVHDKSKFTMHDCVHDLATFVLGDFGFRLEDDNFYHIPSKTRHLSFMKEKIWDATFIINRPGYLRTILPLESNQPFRDAVWLERLFGKQECLRVLSLSQYPCIAELPNSILESKSLRYLDLSSTSIRNIPDTICTLYNLETLLLSNCANLTRLPFEIRRLINLRHLDFAGSPIKELPPRICELKDLQTLTRFIVCKEHSRIEELGDLQQLHGEFEIWGLENVVDVKDVSVAKLREKKFLTSLGLYWDGESCDCDGTLKEGEKILDLLLPHENLKALRIYGFAGERFPDWMGDQSFGNIVEVQLSECKNCKSLPPLGQLPSLKNLQISGFKSVVTIGEEFYSDSSSTTEPFKFLEVLRFEDMAMWKAGLFTKDRNFPNLKELVFSECPKLDVWLPDCFPLLTKLLVSRCRQLMPLLKPTSHQRNEFSSLEELDIFACPEQVIFLQEGLPSSLKKIRISRCRSLEFLHYKNFQHLTSLESLEIIECKELRRLPEELPTTPFKLSIVECPFLESGGW